VTTDQKSKTLIRRRLFVAANRLVNRAVAAVAPRRFRGMPLLVLETVGRRSGRPRRTPLLYVEDDGRYIVVASNGGANWEPAWLLNLRAAPTAYIRIGRDDAQPVGATEVPAAERDALWTKLNENANSPSSR
jgi:F420H(2)-dependent quinone reductase